MRGRAPLLEVKALNVMRIVVDMGSLWNRRRRKDDAGGRGPDFAERNAKIPLPATLS